MDKLQRIHPLDRLIKDDSLFMLEALVPFVDYRFKKLLIFFIKYKELMSIMESFSNPSYISECGFDCHPKTTEDFISDICNFLPGNFASTIKQMKQMQGMMDMMNTVDGNLNHTSSNMSPESILNLLNQNAHNFESTTKQNPTTEQQKEDSLFESIITILDGKS